MAKRILYSSTNRPPSKPNKTGGKKLVETAGYVPTERRINEMILAGRRLSAYREDQFDSYSTNEDDIPIDPTRKMGLDRADITRMEQELAPRLKKKALETSPEPKPVSEPSPVG